MPKVTFTNQPATPGNMGVIHALFCASVHLLFQHCPGHPNINAEFRVTYGTVGPLVQYGGNSLTGFDIYLTANNNNWCMHLYQFCHEICHILSQYQQVQHCNQWFEESFCEASSLYCIKTIAEMGGRGEGPCLNLWAGEIPYHLALESYADKILKSPDRDLNDLQLQQWLIKYQAELRSNPYIRCLNGVVANQLLPLVFATPSNWAALEFINTKPCASGQDSLSQYLDNWMSAAPNKLHTLVNQIKGIFF